MTQVSRKAFGKLLADAQTRVRRWNVAAEDLEKLVGLAVRIHLETPRGNRRQLRRRLLEQQRRYRLFPGLGELILQAIVSRIVSLILEWMLDELQREFLLTVTRDPWILPELRDTP
ncbi:hypothetical protein [Rubinisphaera margarita]|uniref:hypothetical protein n=1 Tax=Rubinisphaera margarita TaxID=2909586 RepID=UPI001EE906B2|nr:hypothetical protein [Rubinisphaera margarita]MCG6157130.1 hypothetical protein [Rubinisphaera margarita]